MRVLIFARVCARVTIERRFCKDVTQLQGIVRLATCHGTGSRRFWHDYDRNNSGKWERDDRALVFRVLRPLNAVRVRWGRLSRVDCRTPWPCAHSLRVVTRSGKSSTACRQMLESAVFLCPWAFVRIFRISDPKEKNTCGTTFLPPRQA